MYFLSCFDYTVSGEPWLTHYQIKKKTYTLLLFHVVGKTFKEAVSQRNNRTTDKFIRHSSPYRGEGAINCQNKDAWEEGM